MIEKYKTDARGPYQDIRWFCKDGSTRAARDPCPGEPGNQHARYKEAVIALAKKDHIFLGQILTSTPHADFWDADHAQSRLKQYQLEQFLRNTDNGWINRRAQFYRGATQAEDENNWGIEFYQWLLEDANRVGSYFFLIRQSAKDLPHKGDNNTAQLVRTLSSDIAEAFPAFQDLRIRIHGMPTAGVIQQVSDFQKNNQGRIPGTLNTKFEELIRELNVMFRPFQVSDLAVHRKRLPLNIEADRVMERFIKGYPTLSSPVDRCQLISRTAMQLRR